MIILCDGSVQLLQDECNVRVASNYELHNLQNDYKMRFKGNDMHDYWCFPGHQIDGNQVLAFIN